MRVHANMLATYFPERNGSPDDFYRQILEQVRLAEELGIFAFWFTEHHFIQYGGSVPNPAMMITAAAARTSTIRLGSCISILPLHHPLRVAEDYAMADLISGGRLEFGIGAGNTQKDYDTFQVDRAQSRERYQEAAEVVLSAWSNDHFSHSGKYWQIPDAELHPRPLQQPHPPIWAAGTSEASLHWAGLHGWNVMTVGHPHTPEKQRSGIAAWRRGLDEAGHDRSQLHAQHHVRIFVDDNRERAQETAKAAIVRYDSSSAARGPRQPGGPTYAMDPEYDWSAMEQTGRNIYGTPEDCIAGVRRAREHYEFDEFSATFNFGGLTHAEVVYSMRLFAAEVLPALPEILGQPEPISA